MRNQYIRIAPSTERPWCQWILPKKSQFLWDRLEPTKWQWSFENQKHGNSLAWAIGTFFAQVLSVNEFFEFSIDVGYALDMLVILLMKLMAIRVDPFRGFFSKMKRSLVIQSAHWFFRCGFLGLFMWVTSFDWFCSRNIENISWSMNSMDAKKCDFLRCCTTCVHGKIIEMLVANWRRSPVRWPFFSLVFVSVVSQA